MAAEASKGQGFQLQVTLLVVSPGTKGSLAVRNTVAGIVGESFNTNHICLISIEGDKGAQLVRCRTSNQLRSLVQFLAEALWSVLGQDNLFHIASVYPPAKWVPSIDKAVLRLCALLLYCIFIDCTYILYKLIQYTKVFSTVL